MKIDLVIQLELADETGTWISDQYFNKKHLKFVGACYLKQSSV